MNELKQALNLAKNKWQLTLIVGFVATVFIFLTRMLPLIGAWVVSIGLLVLQTQIDAWMDGKEFQDISVSRKQIPSLLICSLVLMPTLILMGSSGGLLQKTDHLLQSLAPAYFLVFICLFFYVAIVRSLWIERREEISIAKALDKSFSESFKDLRKKLPLLLMLSLLIIAGELLWGWGLIATLPLVFFSIHYSYKK
jgi:hypothetical protein